MIKTLTSCTVATQVKRVPDYCDVTQMKMRRLTNNNRVIMKNVIVGKTTPRYLTFDDDNICVSPTLIHKSHKFYFKSGDRKIINYVFKY